MTTVWKIKTFLKCFFVYDHGAKWYLHVHEQCCCRISNTRRKIKCWLASSHKLHYGYIFRLTHIFAACKSHEHDAIPKTIVELKDALQQIWTAMLQKSFAKGVKNFLKWL